MIPHCRTCTCTHDENETGETTVEMLRRLCAENGVHVYVGDGVNTEGAAKLLGRAPKTLVNWRGAADHNGLPFYRSGVRGPVRYRLDDIAAWIDVARVEGRTDDTE